MSFIKASPEAAVTARPFSSRMRPEDFGCVVVMTIQLNTSGARRKSGLAGEWGESKARQAGLRGEDMSAAKLGAQAN